MGNLTIYKSYQKKKGRRRKEKRKSTAHFESHYGCPARAQGCFPGGPWKGQLLWRSSSPPQVLPPHPATPARPARAHDLHQFPRLQQADFGILSHGHVFSILRGERVGCDVPEMSQTQPASRQRTGPQSCWSPAAIPRTHGEPFLSQMQGQSPQALCLGSHGGQARAGRTARCGGTTGPQ